jgi:hypothetical protein
MERKIQLVSEYLKKPEPEPEIVPIPTCHSTVVEFLDVTSHGDTHTRKVAGLTDESEGMEFVKTFFKMVGGISLIAAIIFNL